MQVSEGAYLGFYSIYLDNKEYSTSIIGNLWAVAVIAEILMFFMVYKFIRLFGAGKLLVISFSITSLRWLLVAFYTENLFILFFAQTLHAFTFSTAHSAILQLIKKYFGQEHQEQGILIYSGLCLGGGTAIGALVSGFIWETGIDIFIVSSVIACLSSLMIIYWFTFSSKNH